MRTVCTFVAKLKDDNVAISAVGQNQSESKTFLNTDAIADFIIGLNENAEFEEPLSSKYLDAIATARKFGDLEALQGICSELRIQHYMLFNQIEFGVLSTPKSRFNTKLQARIRAKRYSHKYSTFWFVREVKPGQFEPWAHDLNDGLTVATFYCGEER